MSQSAGAICCLPCAAGCGAGFGYLAAATLTTLNPMAGLYYGLGHSTVVTLVTGVGGSSCDAIPGGSAICCPIATIAGHQAGLALAASMGFVIASQTATTLAIALIVMNLALMVLCCCAVGGSIVGLGALAAAAEGH